MPRKPDLIVPIRDRRQGKRIVTVRNFGIATIAFLVLFAVITIRSEMRGSGSASYGRLVERELPKVEHKPVEIVREAVPAIETEQAHADPMLTAPMAREQFLREQVAPAPVAVAVPQRTQAALATGETDVAIVGGPEGVKVTQTERRRPVLSGGFGRQ
ncbi:MAG TPA: hypothetical protein VGQ76_19395 [Thermoanaerobaculia bacterium]|jgi:hypothetical protein|nr:hypothetical protein [Thermoanaerobaculia bacterium]